MGNNMSNQYGQLYVVATPIGNLADISYRAIETLKKVDLIAAEDTRHVRRLLDHYNISTKVISCHQHNEAHMAETLLAKLQLGESIALVSDAGTPLLSDPGMPVVAAVKDAGITVVPVPGACALIAAISAAGMPVSRFSFVGFLPRTSSARRSFYQTMLPDTETWICYESSHRILASLEDMASILPADRPLVIAREITKLHETIVKTTLGDAVSLVKRDPNMQKGEFVVIVGGAKSVKHDDGLSAEQIRLLTILLQQCSIKTAVDMTVEITGARKKLVYQAALTLADTLK